MVTITGSPFTAEELEPTLRPLLEASLLPARAYTDDSVADWEVRNLFRGGWTYVGHASALADRGQYLTFELGGESLLFIGDGEGSARGFYNVCRHRGAQLISEPEGSTRRLQCPYHAWSYGFDGSLRNAPHTTELIDFDPACNSLRQIRTEIVGGLLFCDVSGEAPPLAEHVGSLVEHLDAYRTGELRRAKRIDYDVAANWKAIIENYSECLHCPGVHPELNRLSHYLSGDDYEGPGAWCGGSMTLTKEDADTMALNGGHGGRPHIAGVDPRAVLYFAIFPNCLVSLHPDYVMLHSLWPRAAGRTHVVCEWFFEPETMEREDFDATDAVEFWDLVNRQDWHVCELSQLGLGSAGYTPGRYTEVEGTVHDFDRMVAEAYLR
jgi:phenylpropionate dioxygenase-like ring-hydroxylating dioxygenase large terminal subunit